MEETEVKKDENSLLHTASVLPKLSIVIIIISTVYHIIYYDHFGLPIKYFMNFSELGIAISDSLLYIILVFALLIFSSLFHINISKKYLKRTATKKTEVNEVSFSNSIIQRMWIILLIFSQLIVMFRLKGTIHDILNLLISILFGAATLRLMLKNDNYDNSGILSARNFSFISVFVFASSLRLATDITSVKTGKYKGTIITAAVTTYISSDSTYFIGKTEKYVFIYKSKENGTLVIPTESVKQMFIKSK